MPMDQMPPEQGAQPPQEGGGGAAKLVTDINSGLMKLMDLLQSKFPEDAQKLSAIVDGFQSLIDGLGQAPGPQKATGMVSPEAGAADVKPMM